MNKIQTKIAIAINGKKTSIIRTLLELCLESSSNGHPSSYPFISSDSFRALAHHTFDSIDKPPANIPNIQEGDVVFVGSTSIHNFFKFIHPHIKARYILVTHDGTETIDQNYELYIDDKIAHWFAKNAVSKHPKITPIPIGLENLSVYGSGVTSIFKKLQKRKHRVRKPKIFYHFKIATNPAERQRAFDYISRHPFAETMAHKLPSAFYLKKLRDYVAVLSPEGAGIECHRTWEAMYLGVVPIVKRSPMLDYFKSLGAPLWVVDSWLELDSLNARSLASKCAEIIDKSKKEVLYMDYWIDIIESARKSVFGDNITSLTSLPSQKSFSIAKCLTSFIFRKIKNQFIRMKSIWRKSSLSIHMKAKKIWRSIFGLPTTNNIYTIAILCVKRPAYVDLAIANINSCHFFNPNHHFVIYVDDICAAAFEKNKYVLDYPAQVSIENQFGASNDPWQYSKVEMIIHASKNNRLSVDADEIWHGDIELDRSKITFLSVSCVFKDKPIERGVVEHILKRPEWKEFLHVTSGFLSIPEKFMTDKLANDMRKFTRSIFADKATFLPTTEEKGECRRLAEEFAVCLSVEANYPPENITTLKARDSAKNTEFLQPLYYGCAERVLE